MKAFLNQHFQNVYGLILNKIILTELGKDFFECVQKTINIYNIASLHTQMQKKSYVNADIFLQGLKYIQQIVSIAFSSLEDCWI